MGMAIIGLVLLVVIALGWSVPVGLGVVRIRRGEPWGKALVAVGGIWGVLVLYGAVMASIGIRRGMANAPKDFDFAAYQGGTGTISVPYRGECVLVLADGRKLFRLTAKDGLLKCPVGDYGLQSYSISAADAKGVMWTASSYEAGTRVSVTPGDPAVLEIGPPFTASVKVSRGKTEDGINVDLVVSDCSGASCSIRATPENPPAFQMVSASGAVLFERNLEYG